MIAQAYYNYKPMTIRIFKGHNSSFIAELPLKKANEKEADKALHAIRMRRIEKWRDVSWGKEARIRFMSV